MRNIKLLIEYDGTNYVGWQRQENGASVQGEIEAVLKQILQEDVNVIGAGRTDAGVHARGQVANLRTESPLDCFNIQAGLNGLLPDDIVIHGVEEIMLDFHARYSARERHYSYLISRVPSAMMRSYSWYVKYPLDVELMQETAALLTGEHDYESFCRANSGVAHHRCIVKSARWEIEGSFLKFHISADRFLHGMVRALVGTMVDVGRGYLTFNDFQKIHEKKDRSAAGVSAPANGLVLEEVIY